MRVRCERLVDALGQPVEESRWLTSGREYTVLEIGASSNDRVLLRIVGDEGDLPGLHEASLFATVSPEMSSTWAADIDDRGYLTIGPMAWKRPGFWEDVFDRDPEALVVFRDAYDLIVNEFPVNSPST